MEAPVEAAAAPAADFSAIDALPPVPDLSDVLLQLRAVSTLYDIGRVSDTTRRAPPLTALTPARPSSSACRYADQVDASLATLRHKSSAADVEQRGIAKKMQAKTFAAYPNVDRPQVAIRMLAAGP